VEGGKKKKKRNLNLAVPDHTGKGEKKSGYGKTSSLGGDVREGQRKNTKHTCSISETKKRNTSLSGGTKGGTKKRERLLLSERRKKKEGTRDKGVIRAL